MFDSISDTAMWVAYYRSMEGERAHPLFVDPFARASSPASVARRWRHKMPGLGNGMAVMAIRTHVLGRVGARGRDQGRHRRPSTLDLAAGLDTRPYRLDLPQELALGRRRSRRPILAYKEAKLKGVAPRCRTSNASPSTFADAKARAAFMAGATGKSAEVQSPRSLALPRRGGRHPFRDASCASTAAFRFWAFDYVGWRALKYLQRRWGARARPLACAIEDFCRARWRLVRSFRLAGEGRARDDGGAAKRLRHRRPMLRELAGCAWSIAAARGHSSEAVRWRRVFGEPGAAGATARQSAGVRLLARAISQGGC